MHLVFSALLTSIGILFLLILTGAVLSIVRWKRSGRLVLIITGIWLFIITTKFIPELLIGTLENKYHPINSINSTSVSRPVNIMILGAGFSDDLSLPPNDQLNNCTLGRLSEGIRLYRLLNGCRIVSGGIPGHLRMTQSKVISDAAIAFGVIPDSINCIEIPTNNTNGEASGYIREFGLSRSLLLVTDAIHMPRAMMLFRKAGIEPIPAPTNHIIKHSSYQDPFSWLPSISNIARMDAAMHEYLGILWIKIGRE